MSVAPVLVFGWGNPSRGDDALGPLLLEAIEALQLPDVECLTDFQLQVEHALDLRGRERVLFVDAALPSAFGPDEAFRLVRIAPERNSNFTTHAMSPQAVLQVYADVEGVQPPEAWLLTLRGEAWELGEPLSTSARVNLMSGLTVAMEWLASIA